MLLLISVRAASLVLVSCFGVVLIVQVLVRIASIFKCGDWSAFIVFKRGRLCSAESCRGQTTYSSWGVVGQIIGVVFIILFLNLVQLTGSHHSMVVFILAFSHHHRCGVFGDQITKITDIDPLFVIQ